MEERLRDLCGWGVGSLAAAMVVMSGCGLVNSLQDPEEESDQDVAGGVCEEAEACPAPQGLSIGEVGAERLEVMWEGVAGAVGYVVRWDDEEVSLEAGEESWVIEGLAAPEGGIAGAEMSSEHGGLRIDWAMESPELVGDDVAVEVRALFGEEQEEGAPAEKVGQTRVEVTEFELASDVNSVAVAVDDEVAWTYDGELVVGGHPGDVSLVFGVPAVRGGQGVKTKPYEMVPVPDITLDMGVSVVIRGLDEEGRERAATTVEMDLPSYKHYGASIEFKVDDGATQIWDIPYLQFGADGSFDRSLFEGLWSDRLPVSSEDVVAKLLGGDDSGWAFDWVPLVVPGPDLFVAGSENGKFDRDLEELWPSDGDQRDWSQVLAMPSGESLWLEAMEGNDWSYQGGNLLRRLGADGEEVWSEYIYGAGVDEAMAIADVVVTGTGDIYALGMKADGGAMDLLEWYVWWLDGETGSVMQENAIDPAGYMGWEPDVECAPVALESDGQGGVYTLCDRLGGDQMVLFELDVEGDQVVDEATFSMASTGEVGLTYAAGQDRLVITGSAASGTGMGPVGARAYWVSTVEGLGNSDEWPSETLGEEGFGWLALTGADEDGALWGVLGDSDEVGLVRVSAASETIQKAVADIDGVQFTEAMEVGPGGVIYLAVGETLMRTQARTFLQEDVEMWEVVTEEVQSSEGGRRIDDMAVAPGRRGLVGGLWDQGDFWRSEE